MFDLGCWVMGCWVMVTVLLGDEVPSVTALALMLPREGSTSTLVCKDSGWDLGGGVCLWVWLGGGCGLLVIVIQ